MAAPAKQAGSFIGKDLAAIVADGLVRVSVTQISAAWLFWTGPQLSPIFVA